MVPDVSPYVSIKSRVQKPEFRWPLFSICFHMEASGMKDGERL
ncbi:hypothetical protein HMPREF1326_00411 [Akkermansia sp. KLE1605]|nr:hypothetical protein HMPREF1326_00411 [Akkermansia sp. KLE1605]